jgi:hypothetical protein
VVGNPNIVGNPLAGPLGIGSTTTQNVGYTFTYGLLVVYNIGSRPLTITEVRPELTGNGLRFLGALLAPPSRQLGGADFMEGYPPLDPVLGPMTPAVGSVLDPTADPHYNGWVVALGYTVVRGGRSTVKAVEVTYTVDGQARMQKFRATIALCTPKSLPEAGCPGENG